MDSNCDVRDFLQNHLARHRGLSTLVNESTGRLAGPQASALSHLAAGVDTRQVIAMLQVTNVYWNGAFLPLSETRLFQ
jgi:hypothetical protein